MKKLAPKLKFVLPLAILLLQVFNTPARAKNSCTFTLLDKINTPDVLPWITPELTNPFARAATDITIKNTVNGDAYLAGHIINISGTVDGDLLALGSIINITGTVTQDVRIIGGIVNISGTVGRNVTILGGSVNISPNATITGDIIHMGRNFVFGGSSGGHLKFKGKQATISGIVGQTAEIYASKIQLKDSAVIKRGLILQKLSPNNWSKHAIVPFRAAGFLVALFVGLLLNKFAPRQLKAVTQLTGKHIKKNLLTGLAVLLVTPLVISLLMLSIIGIPVAIVIATMFGVFLAFYEIPMALLFGHFIFDKLDYTKKAKNKKQLWKPGEPWHLAIGIFFIQLLFEVPILGGFTKFIVLVITAGAVATFSKQAYLRLQQRK